MSPDSWFPSTGLAVSASPEWRCFYAGKIKPKTDYYTEANGKVIRDTITLNGKDWTFNQHKKIDTTPTEEDFKKTVADYLAWKVSAILKGQVKLNV